MDYGLVNKAGELIAQPYSYRDDRSRAAVAPVHQKLDPARLYGTTGLQFLQFNTLYQLATEPDLEGLQALLIPDLIAFLLTGVRRTESTNASTTGLFDAVAGEWATEFLTALGLPKDAVPAADRARRNRRDAAAGHRGADRTGPGNQGGGRRLARHRLRRRRRPAATSAAENFAYISSGTWSLVGLELKHPVLTEASREANFTNERGVDGTIRYLRNMGGLWLLSECQRTWAAEGFTPDLTALLTAAAALPPGGPQINPDDSYFIAPDNMPDRIRAAVRHTGPPPAGRPRSHHPVHHGQPRRRLRQGHHGRRTPRRPHRGRGPHRRRRLAEPAAVPAHRRRHRQTVVAGPVEATALGNILVQARAAGKVSGGLADLRRLVAASHGLQTFTPQQLSRL